MKPYPILFETDTTLHGEVQFLHGGRVDSANAFDYNDENIVRILLPRIMGVVSAYIQIFDESHAHLISEIEMEWDGLVCDCDGYSARISNEIGVGLYYFRFRLCSPSGEYFGTRSGDKVHFDRHPHGELFQMTVYDFTTAAPSRYNGGVIYHIFVDRFNRGGSFKPKKGTNYVYDWSRGVPEYPAYPGAPLKNNTFYGGTLWGIIDKLDYIESLGVNLIYLSPIFDAASNHKYDTADYMTVDAMFGGEKALEALIAEAKKRGIGILLDGVFNHTGSDSIYFNREGNYPTVGAYQSRDSEFYPWFNFKEYPNKYTCWWDIDILPRINPDIPECRSYFVDKGGVVDKYAKMGIAGLRLDVVDELSDDFVATIKSRLNSRNKSSILYGEVWEDGSNKIAYDKRKQYYLGKELDGVMNYPIRKGIISYLTRRETADLHYALTDIINNAPKRVRDLQMNLLGTHDTERIVTVLGGESSAGRSNTYLSTKKMNDIERGTAKRRLRMAYTILATVPGIPVIFYGDETALEGYHDPFNRMPYPWDMQDMKTISFFRKLGAIRRECSVYKNGDFSLKILNNSTLAFTRTDSKKIYTTYVNNSKHTQTVEFNRPTDALIGGESGKTVFEIPAFSAEIFVNAKGTEMSL